MLSTNFIFRFAVIALMTSFISCHVIRRDASSGSEGVSATVATHDVTTRTSALYSSPSEAASNELPNGEWQDDSGSEVNNILGAMTQEWGDEFNEQSSWLDSQQSPNELADVNPSTTEMSASTTSTDSSTESVTTSTTSATMSTNSVTSSTSAMVQSTTSTPLSTTPVAPPTSLAYSLDTQSAGTSEPLDGATNRCMEPPEHQLRLNFKRTNQHLKFPALAILPKEGSQQDISPETLELSDGDEYVNATNQCPIELLHVTSSDDLSRRSLCPWSYVPNVDPNRYPSVIQIAKCRCRQCIDTTASQEGAFSNDNNCHQVKFTMTVLRRGECVNGMYMYHNALESIPVACACVRPKV